MGKSLTCVRFTTVQARSAKGTRSALRCAEFASAPRVGKHPYCPGKSAGKKLDGGGRSEGLIRLKHCTRPSRDRNVTGSGGKASKGWAKVNKRAAPKRARINARRRAKR